MGKEEQLVSTNPAQSSAPVQFPRRRAVKSGRSLKTKALLMVCLIGIFIAVSAFAARETIIEGVRYGDNPVYTISGEIGFNDKGSPTIITAQNLRGQVKVTVYRGGNPDDKQELALQPLTPDDSRVVPYLSLRQLNADAHLDLVLTLNGLDFYFINEAGKFRPAEVKDRIPQVKEQAQSLAIVQVASAASVARSMEEQGQKKGLSVIGEPTISRQTLKRVLKEYNSPALGDADYIYDLGLQYNINPAVALAFFVKESSCGTQGRAVENRSFGNIRNSPHVRTPKDDGEFNIYPSWRVGIKDWYDVILKGYVLKGASTIEEIIPSYAPPSENKTGQYIESVRSNVAKWKSESGL